MSWYMWAPRKSAADRRADAARAIHDAARRGHRMSPVAVAGRTIARTFWGKAWCDNLERYRDFAYRLERGRSYVRSGSVIDLQIAAGAVAARVSGSSLYDVVIDIDAVSRDAWRAIQRDCAGGIGSRIDLLAGTLSPAVMTRLCADRSGLFPAPSAIQFRCSCPDVASMCKHVAAAMYGIGARLDRAPELLFTLRKVSLDELLDAAVSELPAAPAAARVLASDGLGALFGIELAEAAAGPAAAQAQARGAKSGRSTPASRASGKPGSGKPGSVKPGSAKPGSGKPGSAKPGSAKPGSAKPTTGKRRTETRPSKPSTQTRGSRTRTQRARSPSPAGGAQRAR